MDLLKVGVLPLGVGLMLGGFVVLILALTFVKITGGDFEMPRIEEGQ